MTDEIGYSLAALSSFGAGRLFKARARTTIVRSLNVRTSQSTEAKMVWG